MLKDEIIKILNNNILSCISVCFESEIKFYAINEIKKIEYENKKFIITTKNKDKYVIYICADVLTIEVYVDESLNHNSYHFTEFININDIENIYFKYDV